MKAVLPRFDSGPNTLGANVEISQKLQKGMTGILDTSNVGKRKPGML